MAQPFFTTSQLIESVSRRISVPLNQSTYQEADFLGFANEEVMMGMVPEILNTHVDYYTFSEIVPIIPGQSRYSIPYRSIGQTLRDMFYIDNAGNMRELTRIQEDDRAYYQEGNSNNYVGFYFEGNEIVMAPPISFGATGSLLFVYYFRPNQIVDEGRTALITSTDYVSRSISAIGLGTTVQVTTTTAHDLSPGDYVRISQSTSIPVIDGLYQVNTTIDSLNFTIIVANAVTVAGLAGFATPGKVNSAAPLPANLTTGSLIDMIEGKNGNRTKGYDITLLSANSGSGQMQFDPFDIPSTAKQANELGALNLGGDPDYQYLAQLQSFFISSTPLLVGDYITTQQETPIPQIPTDMQVILAQRVACRLLESMGDTQGLQNANGKLKEMTDAARNLISDRSRGTPIKINSRRTLIRYSRITFRRGAR